MPNCKSSEKPARPSEELNAVADRVYAALTSMGAYGRSRARRQREVADLAKTNTRHLQLATLVLIERGVPVCTVCDEPMGMFIAETHGELGKYCEQLQSRIKGLASRFKVLRKIARQWIAAETVEPKTGQIRLFV